MLSRLVITFLPRSKHLLISWLQSPSAVILEPKKIKSDTVSTVWPVSKLLQWNDYFSAVIKWKKNHTQKPHFRKDAITLAVSQFSVYWWSSMACKRNSKIFILTPIAQNTVHLLTDFTQLSSLECRDYTYLFFLLPHTAESVAEWTHNKCLFS